MREQAAVARRARQYTRSMADTTHCGGARPLQEERDRLPRQLRELGGGDERLDFDENFADSGQVTAERGEVDAARGPARETLAEIDDALAKLDAGTYGVVRVVPAADRRGPARGDARGPPLHHLRVAAPLTSRRTRP